MRLVLLTMLARLLASLSGCGYNTFQSAKEQIEASWAEVLNQYHRRADLLPDLVDAAKDIAAVQAYTVAARSFPSSLTAIVLGYSVKPSFRVTDEKARAAPPTVELGRQRAKEPQPAASR